MVLQIKKVKMDKMVKKKIHQNLMTLLVQSVSSQITTSFVMWFQMRRPSVRRHPSWVWHLLQKLRLLKSQRSQRPRRRKIQGHLFLGWERRRRKRRKKRRMRDLQLREEYQQRAKARAVLLQHVLHCPRVLRRARTKTVLYQHVSLSRQGQWRSLRLKDMRVMIQKSHLQSLCRRGHQRVLDQMMWLDLHLVQLQYFLRIWFPKVGGDQAAGECFCGVEGG